MFRPICRYFKDAILFITCSIVASTSLAQLPDKEKSVLQKLDDQIAFEDVTVHVFENNGTLIVSIDDRYQIKGTFHDIWDNYNEQHSVAQIRRRQNSVNIGALNIDPGRFNALRVRPEITRRTTVFLDPLCEPCAPLIRALQANKQIGFDVVLIPMLYERSVPLARAFYCRANTKPKQVLNAIADKKLHKLEQRSNCTDIPIGMANMLASIVKVKAVPTVVMPDEKIHAGFTTELQQAIKDYKH